jgi:hypothetical protein
MAFSFANPLKLSVGDYVYMLTEQTGQGRKFQPKYTGPLVVHKMNGEYFVEELTDAFMAKVIAGKTLSHCLPF